MSGDENVHGTGPGYENGYEHENGHEHEHEDGPGSQNGDVHELENGQVHVGTDGGEHENGEGVRWTPDFPEAVRWAPDGSAIDVLDQTRLPELSIWVRLRSAAEVVEAIRTLKVRGAPAIGIAGAMGLALELSQATTLPRAGFLEKLRETAALLRGARPTAVNLAWAVDRVASAAEAELGEAASGTEAGSGRAVEAAAWRAWDEADRIHEEDRAMCRAIGENALALFPEPEDRPVRVMTICNAGALATGGMGTALAAVYLAHFAGRPVRVWAPETRPLLQGSRITAWELSRAGIPVTVIVDSVAADVMARGEVDLVITGADRIAANGDSANKVGTYALAVLARHHGIPFYVAAPSSTIDAATPTGLEIEIEERDPDEVRRGFGRLTAPEEVAVWAPAFDVTPAALITAIVTDRGVFRPEALPGPGAGEGG